LPRTVTKRGKSLVHASVGHRVAGVDRTTPRRRQQYLPVRSLPTLRAIVDESVQNRGGFGDRLFEWLCRYLIIDRYMLLSGSFSTAHDLTPMLTPMQARTARENRTTHESVLNILCYGNADAHDILWLTPLTNGSQFHLYYDI
jgi:hypothetical protein